MMFCSTTKSGKRRRTQKKLPIGSSNPVLRSHRKAKLKKGVELRRKWGLWLHKASWISSPQQLGKKFCAGSRNWGFTPRAKKSQQEKRRNCRSLRKLLFLPELCPQ